MFWLYFNVFFAVWNAAVFFLSPEPHFASFLFMWFHIGMASYEYVRSENEKRTRS